MDKIKKLLLVNVPTGRCNFKCPYCFISQTNAWYGEGWTFNKKAEEVGKAFAMERFGGPCYINLCSKGETLIYPQMIEIVEQILRQGHYVEIVTNGSITARFEAMSQYPEELLSRLSFKFSFHYTELLRLGMLDRFFDNIRMMRDAGASFTLEITPVDEEEPYIEELKRVCMDNLGAWCHCTIARDDREKSIPVLSKHSLEEYCDIWSSLSSPMLKFKKSVFQEKRKEFCYAGDWSLYINLFTGDIRKCYKMPVCGNIYDLNKPLSLEAIGVCPISHCYNAHMLMTFGLLPEKETVTYETIRNRICEDGSEWLRPTVKAFFQSKLIESNEEYSEEKKEQIRKKAKRNMKRLERYRTMARPISGILHKLPQKQVRKLINHFYKEKN